jgi:hypothetical protein
MSKNKNKQKGKMLYIFVEGADDTKFIDNFVGQKGCFRDKYRKHKCVEYSTGNTAAKILRKFDLFEKQGHECVLLADNDKVDDVQHFKISSDKIFIADKEIESWFLAGFSKEFCDKEDIQYIQKTENVDKEIFDTIATKRTKNKNEKNKKAVDKDKSHIQLINDLVAQREQFEFKNEVVENKRSQSLEKFYNHFGLKC